VRCSTPNTLAVARASASATEPERATGPDLEHLDKANEEALLPDCSVKRCSSSPTFKAFSRKPSFQAMSDTSRKSRAQCSTLLPPGIGAML
jgi:hypothetical protein